MLGSVQDKLNRVRPPRVKITYDVDTGGASEKLELPFIVGIFSDLTGHVADPENKPLPPVSERRMVEVDPDNFEELMASCAPAIELKDAKNLLDPVADGDEPKPLSNGDSPALVFTKMEHFEPEFLIKRIEPLNQVYQTRVSLREVQSKMEMVDAVYSIFESSLGASEDEAKIRKELVDFIATYEKAAKDLADAKKTKAAAGPEMTDEEEVAWVKENIKPPADGTVETLVKKGMMIQSDKQMLRSYEIIANFAEVILKDLDKNHELGLASTIDNVVADIDQKLSRQLDEVLHLKSFKERESSWRGLAYLLNHTETGTHLKIRVMNISDKDLLKELSKAVEFDQSSIFKLIYEHEYGTYGGSPYSMLMGDYEFDRTPADQQLLRLMSEIAAAAHAPFVASAYAKLFDMEDFSSLAKPRDLSKIFESTELAQWQSFRESEDSRYVTLALPKVLIRLPWGGEKGGPVDIIDYEENVMGDDAAVDGEKLLWANSAWVLTQRITFAHANFGWTAAIRGVEGGGLVENLPAYTYKSSDGDVELVCPTQVSITDRREKELNDLGFMAICHCKGTSKAAFFGGQTTNLPKKYLTDSATANAQLSSQLPYMLCASRFAHYIKVMMRDKVGTFMTRGNAETFLNNWIAQYILLDDEAPQSVKASYPLRAANVVVTDNPAKPGSYNATVFLRPHFQLEELTTSIRLVAEIPG